jgi:hypothetical protein
VRSSIGLLIALYEPQIGIRAVGSSYVLLAGWLFYYDIARRTVRTKALPHYVAICLLCDYLWLAVGGLIMLAVGTVTGGLLYDALLHALLIGFIISMLFGHAPIIVPALLKRLIRYIPALVAPLVLLHLSVIVRVSADLLVEPTFRKWGGLLNGVAILFFFGMRSMFNGDASLLSTRQARANLWGSLSCEFGQVWAKIMQSSAIPESARKPSYDGNS